MSKTTIKWIFYCKFCGKVIDESSRGTMMCNNCWEVHHRIRDMQVKTLAAILFDLREDLLK